LRITKSLKPTAHGASIAASGPRAGSPLVFWCRSRRRRRFFSNLACRFVSNLASLEKKSRVLLDRSPELKAAEKMQETELLGDFIRDVFGDLLGYLGPASGAPVQERRSAAG
jgi:hypothetical protein